MNLHPVFWRSGWTRPLVAGLLAMGMAVAAAPAVAMDLSLAAAHGDTGKIRKAGVVLGWTHPRPLWEGATWRLMFRHEVELAGWRVPQASNLIEAGYSPVLRLERPASSANGATFFVSASIGVRLLSHTRLTGDKTMSTAFQFSDELGAGLQWGAYGAHTVGLRYQHLSNASIKKPNPGINFVKVYYRYSF